ncbi:putative tail length tape measure protein [Escherichia coli]|nr:putative tail length tape measure protein [Escherichia coli]
MAEPVGDLVVDLSLDAARFDEQMARVRRHFSGTESDAKKTAAVVEQSLSRQALLHRKRGFPSGSIKLPCVCCLHSSPTWPRSLQAGKVRG